MDIDISSDLYSFIKRIGSGSSSDVYLAKQISNNNLVVIKIMKNYSPIDKMKVNKEKLFLNTLDHPFIIKLLNFIDLLIFFFNQGYSLQETLDFCSLLNYEKEVKEIKNYLNQGFSLDEIFGGGRMKL